MQSTAGIDSCIFHALGIHWSDGDRTQIGKGNKSHADSLNGTKCNHLVEMSAGDVI